MNIQPFLDDRGCVSVYVLSGKKDMLFAISGRGIDEI
jgi:hypothetical protein